MQPDPIRVEETLAWMKKSRKDLWRAESYLLSTCALWWSGPPTACSFHRV
jgi:hypothetical protein